MSTDRGDHSDDRALHPPAENGDESLARLHKTRRLKCSFASTVV